MSVCEVQKKTFRVRNPYLDGNNKSSTSRDKKKKKSQVTIKMKNRLSITWHWGSHKITQFPTCVSFPMRPSDRAILGIVWDHTPLSFSESWNCLTHLSNISKKLTTAKNEWIPVGHTVHREVEQDFALSTLNISPFYWQPILTLYWPFCQLKSSILSLGIYLLNTQLWSSYYVLSTVQGPGDIKESKSRHSPPPSCSI